MEILRGWNFEVDFKYTDSSGRIRPPTPHPLGRVGWDPHYTMTCSRFLQVICMEYVFNLVQQRETHDRCTGAVQCFGAGLCTNHVTVRHQGKGC